MAQVQKMGMTNAHADDEVTDALARAMEVTTHGGSIGPVKDAFANVWAVGMDSLFLGNGTVGGQFGPPVAQGWCARVAAARMMPPP